MYHLTLLPERLAVCRLPAPAPLPAWAVGDLVSLTRTGDELSVVCAESAVPDGVAKVGGRRCLRVAGPLDFALVGVLSSLLVPLADAGVAVFVVSTFDTDYLLVAETDIVATVDALRRAGHTVTE